MMQVDLTGKVALVTGGARDIGRAICIAFAKCGAKVVINYHSSAEPAKQLAADIKQSGGDAIAVGADVSSQADVENLVNTATEFGGGIDILVNNAGGLLARKKLEEMDERFWDSVMSLNLKSVFLVTKAAVPHMKEGSSIVNLASLAARDGGGARCRRVRPRRRPGRSRAARSMDAPWVRLLLSSRAVPR